MLAIRVERFGFGKDSTLSEWTFSGDNTQPWHCYGCEDERRIKKVYGETCIPEGIYEIKLRTDSTKFKKYYARYDFHRGMLWLQNVLGFEWIYIHTGNDDEDTMGCLLPGVVPIMLPDGEFEVRRSRDAYVALYKRVIAAFDRNERVFVEIVEREAA